ncbi:MAG: GxGYxYP domain-containing protein [Salinibacter sp.]
MSVLCCALLLGLGTAPLSAQPTEPPPRSAAVMHLEAGWTVDGALPTKAFLISLQGVVNQGAPRLYFVYPPDWTYPFTEPVADYYRDTHNIRFSTIETPRAALSRFREHVEGYVVWDRDVRTSLNVAFTLAGLENAVVVTADQIPMVEAAGLAKVGDFRGQFTGQTDAEIYRWAWTRYGERCSKEVIVWMGGVSGHRMQPGIADYGIYRKAFFTDLSANPQDTTQLALADRILDSMNTGGLVMGWHSYAKDTEGQHVTLVSQHALAMEGLNTLPNTSFNTQISTTPGFSFENNHSVPPDTTLSPEKKVYVSPVQTDGLGIGAWRKPGRGSIPYAWEVTMNWAWLSPAILQYFYQQATPNDYFIGSLSGPGYLYPKAVPDSMRPALIDEAKHLMQRLDLRVFETMDYSEGNRLWGTVDLPKSVVDDYYEGMPNAIGFINGYGPASTFDLRDGRPFVSYDYYLSPDRPKEAVLADLRELARLNPERPYFLLLHVRQRSSIERVKSILDALGDEFEVVALDRFLKLAAGNPTFEYPRYRGPPPKVPPTRRPAHTGVPFPSSPKKH